MKLIRLIRIVTYGLFLALPLAGCEEGPADNYGADLVDKYRTTQERVDATGLNAIDMSIRTFQAVHGRYPKSLEELGAFMGARIDAAKYGYDPSTGKASLK